MYVRDITVQKHRNINFNDAFAPGKTGFLQPRNPVSMVSSFMLKQLPAFAQEKNYFVMIILYLRHQNHII